MLHVHSAGALTGYPSHLYSQVRDSAGPLPPYGVGAGAGGAGGEYMQSPETTSPARGTPRVSYADYAESPQMALMVASLDAGDRPQSAPQVALASLSPVHPERSCSTSTLASICPPSLCCMHFVCACVWCVSCVWGVRIVLVCVHTYRRGYTCRFMCIYTTNMCLHTHMYHRCDSALRQLLSPLLLLLRR